MSKLKSIPEFKTEADCAALARRNLVAVQFHPEKSGRPGLQILANFCRWGGEDAE